eukprot:CAMPEP_0116893700 /NCGR_PEP_ID=MMETSP0467-20121206/3635_1 /TAXON_ID=283647 /ORGANISM="Mesodinium pulex, Strain SPMC105" /LENGTH=75 /DNA_ID=CAMNT_0004563515 /DNA_START=400 /DNA_END=627 /DNA_ORIENTATION=+
MGTGESNCQKYKTDFEKKKLEQQNGQLVELENRMRASGSTPEQIASAVNMQKQNNTETFDMSLCEIKFGEFDMSN